MRRTAFTRQTAVFLRKRPRIYSKGTHILMCTTWLFVHGNVQSTPVHMLRRPGRQDVATMRRLTAIRPEGISQFSQDFCLEIEPARNYNTGSTGAILVPRIQMTAEPDDTAELLNRVRAGDLSARGSLFERHK